MTAKQKILIVGAGGRESAFALNLARDSQLYAVLEHANPTIVGCVRQSGGAYTLGDCGDPQTVTNFAKQCGVQLAFVSADAPLANGVTDALMSAGINTVGGSRAAARLEWDKLYAMDIMRRLCPAHTPFYRVLAAADDIKNALAAFEARGAQVVVKPQGLSGGKGVKVMPTHLSSYAAAAEYARELLQSRPHEKVLLVEKLHGFEFTVMGFTDGEQLVTAPPTYDYPYRHEGDNGAGTGGMGCFTAPAVPAAPGDNSDAGPDGANLAVLPFMRPSHLQDCRRIMQKVLDHLRAAGISFCGVLNGGFFITPDGVRFMEFNSRFGDPEALNILLLLQTPLSQLLQDLSHKRLSPARLRFSRQASVVKYFVAQEYPQPSPTALDFSLDNAAITAMQVQPIYASCVEAAPASPAAPGTPGNYRTLKKSRVVALATLASSVCEGAARINAASRHIKGNLHYRRDIGSEEEMQRLSAPLSVSSTQLSKAPLCKVPLSNASLSNTPLNNRGRAALASSAAASAASVKSIL